MRFARWAAWPAAALATACFARDPALQAGIAQVQQQPEKARVTLRPLAEQGNEAAIAHICNAYGRSIDSEVGTVEREQAFGWCEHAAQAGDVQAQYVLGTFYASGIGVEADRVQALAWYRQAAGHGHREAVDAVRGMEGKPPVCRNWITNCRLF